MSLISVFFNSDTHEKHLRQKNSPPDTHTHTHTHTHAPLRTFGQIPVLSGCCGTPELSKPRHNPLMGQGAVSDLSLQYGFPQFTGISFTAA